MYTKKRKMIIHCASGIKNSGDEAILEKIIGDYREAFDITVISLNRVYTENLHREVRVLDNNSKLCKKYIKQCDIFLLGGGGLLQDSTSIFNILRWLKKLKLALKFHRKTYVYANSIGPLKYRISKILVRKYLCKVDKITLRDDISRCVLKELGIIDNVEVTADPVFSFEISKVEADRVIDKYKLSNQYVSISIRHWFDTIPFLPVSVCTKLKIRTSKNNINYKKYIDTLREIVTYINMELDLPVCFISFCYDRDATVAEDILNTDELKNINKIINDESMTPSEAMSIIEKSEFLIGMRLHSIIYSMNSKTPVLPIIYEEKVKGIINLAGIEEYTVNVNDMTAEQLKIKLKFLLDHKEKEKEIINVFYEKMLMKEKNNIVNLKNLFDIL